MNNNDDNGNVSSFGQHNLSSPSPLQLLSTTSTATTMFGSYVFDPHVQAQCERNLMNIMVTFDQPFNGIVHVRNFRRNPCQIYGNGSTIVTMTIDLLTPSNRPNFCGIHRVKVNLNFVFNRTIMISKKSKEKEQFPFENNVVFC